MNNQWRMSRLLILHHHREVLVRLVRAIDEESARRIRRARRNLQNMRRIVFEFTNEIMNIVAGQAITNVVPRIRTIGKKERSSEWWDRDVLLTYDTQQWLEDFRMDRETFFRLVDFVRGPLAVAEETFIESLSVEKKVGIAVHKLASCSEYRAIGKGFGVSKSTVCVCVHAFCKALINTQLQNLISWPNREECEQISAAFEERFKLPNVIGLIDGTHIPISPPKDGAADFHNRKGYSFIVTQVVVDHQLLFRDVTAKHPGCNHDASVLRDSYLFQNQERLFPESDKKVNGIEDGNGVPILFRLPYYIIGDPAYPLSDWLMKNFQNEQNEEEVSFNLYLNSARVLVEHAIGRLKGRWRILCKKSDLDVYNMPHVIITCCMLHNFIEKARQQYVPRWDQEALEDAQRFPQPNRVRDNDVDINLMRVHLSSFMARNHPLLNRQD